jgi:hypothetical protein
VINERRKAGGGGKQENISPLNPHSLGASSSQHPHSSQKAAKKAGRSFSDDRANNRLDLDEIDISNEFDVNMDDDEDDNHH